MKSFKKKACKVLSAVLSVMMTTTAFTGLMTTNVSAATVLDQSGNFVYTDLDDGTIEITKCNSNGDVDIPSSIDGKKVTTIGEFAFSDGVTSVSIPESVVTIQDYAFYNCYSLEDIEFSEGLTYIGKEAFYYCNIQELTLPETLEEIDEMAFSGNYSIQELNFPKTRGVKMGLDAIPTGSWYWERPDGPIVSGKTFIRYKAYNAYVPEYTIPDGIETIAPYAFSDLYSTQQINIPDSVKYICEYAFAYTNIAEADLPDGVEFIGHRAFENCYSLKNVTLPNSLTYIGSNAFSSCYDLTGTIAIPDSVTYLGEYAFAYTNVANLEISDNNSITYFGRDILSETPWYEALPNGEIYFGNIFVGIKNDDESITEINIKDGTKVIASYALYCFNGSINIPDSVEYVNDYGLAYANITNSNFPKNVKEIGNYAFCGCEGITHLEIPSSLKTIGRNAFHECENLTSMSDTKNVTSIGDDAFRDTAIVTFKIGSGLSKLGKSVFCNNTVLKEFTVSSENKNFSTKDGVLYNKDQNIMISYPRAKTDTKLVITPDILDFIGAFDSSNLNITEIVIEEGVLSIPTNAFTELYMVETITIPTTVKKIGEHIFSTDSALHTVNYNAVDCTATNAFASCENLTTVNFGENVTKISDEMFAYCYNLTNVLTNGKIELIGNRAFYDTKWDNNIRNCAEGEIVYVDKVAYCSNNPTGSVVVKDGTKSLCSEVFSDCSNLTSITIPDSVEYIGEQAFNCCTNLENIEMSSNVMYIGDYAFSQCYMLQDIDLGNNLTHIGDSAFSSCSKLNNINLGNKLTYLGEYAFCNCTSLESITIPSGVDTILTHTFADCSSLKSITLNEGIEYIGDYAFTYTGSLESLKLPSTVERIGYEAFYQSGINNIELNEGLKTIEGYAFEYCESLESINCPSTLKTIGHNAFYGCRALKSVTLNECLEEIGNYAFEYCEALESIEIPSSVKTIGYEVFEYCTSLKTVTFNEGLESIGGYAFYGCTSLENIVLPSTVKTIEYCAFSNCDMLKNITLNEGLESIGTSAFYGTAIESIEIPTTLDYINYGLFTYCTNLKSVTLHEGLTDICDGSFQDCPSLTEIFIPSTVNYIAEYTFSNDMIIYGYEGSYAQAYVENHWYDEELNHTFVAIERTMGDINGDGIVTITDATELQKYLAGMITLTDKQLACADVTDNGNIDIKDVSYITKALAGIVEL